MAYLKLPIKDFPNLASYVSGDKLRVTLTGSVALKMLGGGDDFITLEVSEHSSEKDMIRQHPAEIMKQMVELQGLQNTPIL